MNIRMLQIYSPLSEYEELDSSFIPHDEVISVYPQYRAAQLFVKPYSRCEQERVDLAVTMSPRCR